MNFTLRPWNHSDIDSLVKHANNIEIAKFMTDQFPHPYTKEKGLIFIDFASKGSPTNIFAIDINGEAIGGIGLHLQADIHRKNAEMGYWLSQTFWGKGIVTKAIVQMVEYGFSHFDINRIFAKPFGTNIASQKVLEKAGFVLEGRFEKSLIKHEAFVDELVYAIRKQNLH